MFQAIFVLSFAAFASCTPQGGYAPEKLPPKPFSYQYGVADDYSKANFQKTESQDAKVRRTISILFVDSMPYSQLSNSLRYILYNVALTSFCNLRS